MHTDLTREEILRILKSFGVSLPVETKLSLEDLDKRLCSCFNAAQRKDKLPNNLAPFNLWPSQSIPLSYVVGRYNRREVVQRARGNYGPDRFTDVFTDLRQVVLELAEMLDESSTVYLVQDPEMEHAIAIRVCISGASNSLAALGHIFHMIALRRYYAFWRSMNEHLLSCYYTIHLARRTRTLCMA